MWYSVGDTLNIYIAIAIAIAINVNGINEIQAADIIDMQAFSKHNNAIKYLLTVIDIFLICLDCSFKTETGQEVANAFSRILKERRPSKMWVDKKGREFYNKDVKKLVELYSTENEDNLV